MSGRMPLRVTGGLIAAGNEQNPSVELLLHCKLQFWLPSQSCNLQC